MNDPTDPPDKRPPYWIRGERTRRHSYFYPRDDRAGFALMLFIAVLGLLALIFGIRGMLGSPQPQRRDMILSGIGLLSAVLGLYQANRLRRS
jgi:hypothetical protein